ncbi:substrate binding domain-containing protein [Kiloniella litopenaei]|uniref:substrate binding domain-containing protein n=1 Tax=Kiloniella litopenaei TaxID=1549748 RepID=UPI003BABF307
MEEAEDAVANLHAAPRGTLKINVPELFGRLWITGLIPEFMTLYPEIKLDLNLQDRFVDLLSEGYDLAVRIGDLEDSSLIARKLAANRRVVCASPEYLKKHGAPQHPKDLENHDCLIYASRAFRNDWRFEGPDGAELVHVSGAVETNNPEVIMDLTCKNMGISLLPLWLVGPRYSPGSYRRSLARLPRSRQRHLRHLPPGSPPVPQSPRLRGLHGGKIQPARKPLYLRGIAPFFVDALY